MTKHPKLTAARLDALFARGAPHAHAPEGRIIWTAKNIGERIGRSESWVRKVLAKYPGSPVQQTETGQLYAYEDRLIRHFRGKDRH